MPVGPGPPRLCQNHRYASAAAHSFCGYVNDFDVVCWYFDVGFIHKYFSLPLSYIK